MSVSLLRRYVREVIKEARAKPFDMGHFKSLKTEDEAQEYLDFHAKVIGAGMGRTAFDVGNGLVVKMAQNHNGNRQNESEATILSCSPDAPVPTLHDTSMKSLGNHAWIIVDKVTPLKGRKNIDAAVSNMVRQCDSLDDLIALIWAGMHESYAADDKEQHARLEKYHRMLRKSNPWYRGMFELFNKCELSPDEMHEANFGVDAGGRMVMLDTGQ